MTLQNRVDPWGEIHAVAERGGWMGNRGGCFHDDKQRLTHRRWATKQWITCRLEFKGWHREVMTPNRYTELFFLDEATALAAGHRPCFECRRQDALRFRDAWSAGQALASPASAGAMDRLLHAERLDGRRKRTFVAAIPELPDGTMVAGEQSGEAWLLWEGRLFPWSFAGYGRPISADSAGEVVVLTPPSTVAAIRAGYTPQVALPEPL